MYKDEIIYSFYARMSVRMGFTEPGAAFNAFFLNMNGSADLNFFGAPKQHILNRLKQEADIETLIRWHTAFNGLTMLLPDVERGKIYAGVSTFRKVVTKGTKRVNVLMCCPECIKEDREQRGEAYYHVSHQIPGIAVCPLHGVKLLPAVTSETARAKLIPLDSIMPGDAEYVGVNMTDSARYIRDMIEHGGPFSFQRLRDLLWSRGYIFGADAKDADTLASDMSEFYGEDVISDTCSSLLNKPKAYMRTLCNIRAGDMIRVMYFLEHAPVIVQAGSSDEAIVQSIKNGTPYKSAADRFGTSTVHVKYLAKKSGIKKRNNRSDTRYFSKKDRLELYREMWLKIQKENPEKTFAEMLRNRELRKYLDWISIHDRDFAEAHPFRTPPTNPY